MDPLRAGQVAVFDDQFQYFCGPGCRQSYLRSKGRADPDEVETAAPPAVVALSALASWNAQTGTRGDSAPLPPPVSSRGAASVAAVTPDTASHAQDPSPASGPRAREQSSGERTIYGVDQLGMICGALVPAVELVGRAAEVARLPLVLVAFGSFLLRASRMPRDAADPHPASTLVPMSVAAVAATWAWCTHDAAFPTIAALAGLSAAAAIAVGRLVSRARTRTNAARARIETLLDIRVRAFESDVTIEMPSAEVRAGEAVFVEAGELVGVDGMVAAGEARVQLWLDAGYEALRREGDPIVAGARLLSGRLRITTTWSGRERAWVKLLSSPATRIDVCAPTALAVRSAIEWGAPGAALVLGLATLAANASVVAVMAAMAAGGVALALTAMSAFVGAHFARAHLEALANGIAYKDAVAFERAGAAEVAVLSARGTVLHGEPEIVAVELIGTPSRSPDRLAAHFVEDASRVLSLAAGAETGSNHPLASAILRAARAQGITPDPVRNASLRAGLGVTAVASNGERLVVGGRALMLEEKIGGASANARIGELESQGRTVLLVALRDRIVGLIALQDGLRAGARAAIQKLLDVGIEPVLLSGEARETCETIGRALDIDHVRPEILPTDRGAAVRALSEGGSVVAAVGHPASDDAALGAADVSVAMGAAGGTPREWGVALASDDLRAAALALAIPRITRGRVRRAIALTAVPVLLALLAAGFGVAPLAAVPLAALVGVAGASMEEREYASRTAPAPTPARS